MARDEQIRIDVDATDNASAKIDKVSDAARRLEGQDVSIGIDADSAGIDAVNQGVDDLVGNLGAATGGLQTLRQTLDKFGTAGLFAFSAATNRLKALDEQAVRTEFALSNAVPESAEWRQYSQELTKAREEMARLEAARTNFIEGESAFRGRVRDLGAVVSQLAASPVLQAAPVLAYAAAAVQAANTFADTAAQVKVISDLLGSSTEEASALLTVFTGAGVEANDLQDVILQMNGVLAQSPELAAQLGVALGASPLRNFIAVVDATNQIADATQRATLQSQLFGEEGVRQVARISAQYGELATAITEVDPSRLFTDEDIASAAAYKAEMRDLSGEFREIATDTGRGAASALAEILSILNATNDAVERNTGKGGLLRTWLDPDEGSWLDSILDGLGTFTGGQTTAAAATSLTTEQIQRQRAAQEQANAVFDRYQQMALRQQGIDATRAADQEALAEAAERTAQAEEDLADVITRTGSEIVANRSRVRNAEADLAEARADLAEVTNDERVRLEEELADAYERQADQAERLAETQERVTQAQERVGTANERVLETAERIGDAEERLVDARERASEATSGLQSAQSNVTRLMQGYGSAARETADALERLDDAQRGLERSQLSLVDAQTEAADAEANLARLRRFYGDDPQGPAAKRRLRDAEIAVAKARLGVADATDALQGSQEDLNSAQQDYDGYLRGFPADSAKVRAALEEQKRAEDNLKASLNGVESAQRGVTSAEQAHKDAQAGVVTAIKSVEQAHKDVAKAQRDLGAASYEAIQAQWVLATYMAGSATPLMLDSIARVNDAQRQVNETLREQQRLTDQLTRSQEMQALIRSSGPIGIGWAAVNQRPQSSHITATVNLSNGVIAGQDAGRFIAETLTRHLQATGQLPLYGSPWR